MPNTLQLPQLVSLEALRALVCDHGDAFRWSVSKKGRIWLTLTHWDTEKYNTSVELGGMSDLDDMVSGLSVLCVAHRGKCFGSVAHSDTWLGEDETKRLAGEALEVLRSLFSTDVPDETPATPLEAASTKTRDKGSHAVDK
jgi:hypothetical protein